MNKLIFSTLLFLTCINYTLKAQTLLKAELVDSLTLVKLRYVNIGIKNKNLGAISKEDGSFSINIPYQNDNDTLTFSLVGYQELNLPIKGLAPIKQIKLKQSVTELATVSVRAKKMEERKFGISKKFAIVHFTDGSINQKDIFEIAQLVKLDTSSQSRLTSVNLYLSNTRTDSGTFRINVYDYYAGLPGKKIVEKNIIQTKAIKPGWLKFDLMSNNIYVSGDVVVAIEFIPSSNGKNESIVYEVSPLGSGKSFVRANSQGKWKVPPHKYRMFVTALVSKD